MASNETYGKYFISFRAPQLNPPESQCRCWQWDSNPVPIASNANTLSTILLRIGLSLANEI